MECVSSSNRTILEGPIPHPSTKGYKHTLVQQLTDFLSTDSDFQRAFITSFNAAKAEGLEEFKKYKIDTFDDYINFYDDFLRWTPREECDAKEVYRRLCLFYFVLGLPPLKKYLGPIKPPSDKNEPWTWLTQWLVSYAKEIGKFMDSPGSLTPESIHSFYHAKNYHISEYEKPTDGWKTFNEFFARRTKPEVRPIIAIDDPCIIVSPADATYFRKSTIDQGANVEFKDPEEHDLSAKGVPWRISDLLQDTAYAESFKGGQFTHAWLAPTDYHRLHAAVAGKVVEAKVVPGACYLQVVAETDPLGKRRLSMHRRYNTGLNYVEAPDESGYLFLQARGIVVIKNPDIGLVAICPIGMAQISSVVLSVKKGDYVNKGDEISYFQYGGSDVVLLFEARSNVIITTEEEKHYNFGTQIATVQQMNQ